MTEVNELVKVDLDEILWTWMWRGLLSAFQRMPDTRCCRTLGGNWRAMKETHCC